MTQPEYEQVTYPVSTYVWCKGSLSRLDRHPIFVSSPVRFARDENGRYTLLACHDQACRLCGRPTRYEETEMGFQTGYVPPEKAHTEQEKEPIAGCTR